ncbi:MAG: ABC transporter substrate-binding protein [Sphingopyxis sp.]
MNPCVDAVLVEIADPRSIAAISHYSHDARATSIPLSIARQYASVADGAEDVIAANPDLVIAGPHASLQTIAALQRLGISLMQVGVPETVAENQAQIAQIAARIGRPAHGAALNRRIDAAMAATRRPGAPVTALIWQGNGLVPGAGTLADTLLTHTGFHNISPDIGLKNWDILPLEGLLSHPPRALLTGRADMVAGNADASRMATHPALRHAAALGHGAAQPGAPLTMAAYPSNLLHCGGPVIIRAVARMAAIRRSMDAATLPPRAPSSQQEPDRR